MKIQSIFWVLYQELKKAWFGKRVWIVKNGIRTHALSDQYLKLAPQTNSAILTDTYQETLSLSQLIWLLRKLQRNGEKRNENPFSILVFYQELIKIWGKNLDCLEWDSNPCPFGPVPETGALDQLGYLGRHFPTHLVTEKSTEKWQENKRKSIQYPGFSIKNSKNPFGKNFGLSRMGFEPMPFRTST